MEFGIVQDSSGKKFVHTNLPKSIKQSIILGEFSMAVLISFISICADYKTPVRINCHYKTQVKIDKETKRNDNCFLTTYKKFTQIDSEILKILFGIKVTG